MFSLEPQRTDYDVNFSCCGFSVRVHPMFWLAALILGASGVYDVEGHAVPDAGVRLLTWIVVMFVSILVHELGHAVVMRYFGQASHIVLYMLGGLAIPDSSVYSYGRPARQTPANHIVISLAGPGAGFLLAALTVGLIFAIGGEFRFDLVDFPFFFHFQVPPGTSQPLRYLISDLLFMNILWGLVNLLPVYPLDGGQVSRQLFEQADAWHGFVRSLWLSIVTSVIIAIGSWAYLHLRLMPLMFISLAATNYMMLQQITGGGFGGRRW